MRKKLKGYDGKQTGPVQREAGSFVKAEGSVHTFVFSNAQVDRYGDTIDPNGWELKNYDSNPIVLFGHDATDVKNVVGRTVKTWVENGCLMGDIEFVEEGVNPNADIVRKLVQAKILKTVSVGFQPIEAKASSDPKRKGGWDFKKQELLEVSIVPVPALPSALAKGAEAGFDRETLVRSGAVVEVELPKFEVKDFWTLGWLASLMGDADWLYDMMDEGEAGRDKLLAGLQSMGQALCDMSAECLDGVLAKTPESGDEDCSVIKLAGLDPREVALGMLALAQKDIGVATVLDSCRKYHESGHRVVFSVDKEAAAPLARAGRVLSADNEAVLNDVKTTLTEACGKVEKVLAQVAQATETVVQASAPATGNSEDEVARRRALVAKRLGSVN